MQIVFVSHSYPRHEHDVAGAFVERLALALRDRSHSVKVIAPSEEGEGGRERLHGISVSRVRYGPSRMERLAYQGDMHERARSPLGAAAAASLVFAAAAEIGHLNRVAPVDIVHAHWWVPAGLSAWLARLIRRPRYVVTLHGTDVEVLDQSWMGRFVARRVLRGATAVTAVSSFLAERAAKLAGLDAERILIQPMPVDVKRFNRVSRGGAGIVAIGRLTPQKNVDVVLEAASRLKQMGKATRTKIIGEGPERERLERRAKGLGIDKLTEFAGRVRPDRLPDAIGEADVLVFPAVREGLGLVAAEALMLGIPVVATRDGGGVTDIVPPTGPGRLVKSGDPYALANAIADFLNNPSARQMATQAGESLRRRLAPESVAEVFESVYLRALGRGTGRSAS